jgi:hypothetical protein
MKIAILILFLIILIQTADKEAWKARSIYQLLTDRFARNDGQNYGCDNLGTLNLIKVIIVAEDTEVS